MNMELKDVHCNLEMVSLCLESLEIISERSDHQTIATAFAPMLLQIRLMLNKENEKINRIAEGLK